MEERRRNSDFVTREVCEIKETNFEKVLERIEMSISKAVDTMASNDLHHREVQGKLLEKIEKKQDKITIGMVSGFTSVISAICIGIIWLSEKLFAKQ